MTRYLFRFLATTILLAIGHVMVTFAQSTVAQLQTELVAPWLVTVEGEARTRSLKILGLAEKSEGAFLVDATYGWIDGTQSPVRAEITQAGPERRLQITTPPGSLIVATQSPDGSFTGTFTPKNGTAKAVKLEKFSEQDMQIRIRTALATREAQGARVKKTGSFINTIGSSEGIAISGFDTVAFFTEKKALQGKSEYTFEWMGAKWLFSSQDNLNLFKANPEKYAPQYGGLCAYGVSEGYISGKPADGQFEVMDGKLYLFPNRGAHTGWWQSGGGPRSRIANGDLNWPNLKARLESRRK